MRNEYDIPFVVTLHMKNTYAVLRVHVIKIEGQPYVLLQLEPLTVLLFCRTISMWAHILECIRNESLI